MYHAVMTVTLICAGIGRAQSAVRRTRDPTVGGSIPGRSGERIFFLGLAFCADSYSVSVPSPCNRTGT